MEEAIPEVMEKTESVIETCLAAEKFCVYTL